MGVVSCLQSDGQTNVAVRLNAAAAGMPAAPMSPTCGHPGRVRMLLNPHRISCRLLCETNAEAMDAAQANA